jgi:hypothetical protein
MKRGVKGNLEKGKKSSGMRMNLCRSTEDIRNEKPGTFYF